MDKRIKLKISKNYTDDIIGHLNDLINKQKQEIEDLEQFNQCLYDENYKLKENIKILENKNRELEENMKQFISRYLQSRS